MQSSPHETVCSKIDHVVNNSYLQFLYNNSYICNVARGCFTFSEATTAISVFLPITSVYTSTIIKDIIAGNRSAHTKEIIYRIRSYIMYTNFNVYNLSSYDYHRKGL